MNNEPVAWISQDVLDADHIIKAVVRREQDEQHTIPLYTHPVKELDEQFKKGFEAGKEEGWKAHKFHHPVKELTDEEILEICDLGEWHKDEFAINFARAILRKTQEK